MPKTASSRASFAMSAGGMRTCNRWGLTAARASAVSIVPPAASTAASASSNVTSSWKRTLTGTNGLRLAAARRPPAPHLPPAGARAGSQPLGAQLLAGGVELGLGAAARLVERRGVGRAHEVAVPRQRVLDLDSLGRELAGRENVVGGDEVVQRRAAVRVLRRILVRQHRHGEKYECNRNPSIHGSLCRFWILDFGFWIWSWNPKSKIPNPKSSLVPEVGLEPTWGLHPGRF